jgi:hypothetical protein
MLMYAYTTGSPLKLNGEWFIWYCYSLLQFSFVLFVSFLYLHILTCLLSFAPTLLYHPFQPRTTYYVLR